MHIPPTPEKTLFLKHSLRTHPDPSVSHHFIYGSACLPLFQASLHHHMAEAGQRTQHDGCCLLSSTKHISHMQACIPPPRMCAPSSQACAILECAVEKKSDESWRESTRLAWPEPHEKSVGGVMRPWQGPARPSLTCKHAAACETPPGKPHPTDACA